MFKKFTKVKLLTLAIVVFVAVLFAPTANALLSANLTRSGNMAIATSTANSNSNLWIHMDAVNRTTGACVSCGMFSHAPSVRSLRFELPVFFVNRTVFTSHENRTTNQVLFRFAIRPLTSH